MLNYSKKGNKLSLIYEESERDRERETGAERKRRAPLPDSVDLSKRVSTLSVIGLVGFRAWQICVKFVEATYHKGGI